MTEYPHNGVICKNCHTTIDLTEAGAGAILRRETRMRRGFLNSATYETGDFFENRCPKCGSMETYSHKEVMPLFDWKGLEERIGKLEKRFDDPHFHSDVAKAVLKQLAEQDPKQKEQEGNPLAH